MRASMRNPFRSEEAAFRLVWLTIAYFALIVLGAWINRWLGLGVFVVETGALAWWLSKRGAREQPLKQTPADHPSGERRLLVVANETVGGRELLSELRKRSEGSRSTCSSCARP